jgi:hypothetical protein
MNEKNKFVFSAASLNEERWRNWNNFWGGIDSCDGFSINRCRSWASIESREENLIYDVSRLFVNDIKNSLTIKITFVLTQQRVYAIALHMEEQAMAKKGKQKQIEKSSKLE